MHNFRKGLIVMLFIQLDMYNLNHPLISLINKEYIEYRKKTCLFDLYPLYICMVCGIYSMSAHFVCRHSGQRRNLTQVL